MLAKDPERIQSNVQSKYGKAFIDIQGKDCTQEQFVRISGYTPGDASTTKQLYMATAGCMFRIGGRERRKIKTSSTPW